MAYVVTDRCIACRYTDCVAVCPVDCFRSGPSMLVIAPDECIDCGVCVPECPAKAIRHDSDPAGSAWLDFNARYAARWPSISQTEAPLPDAEEHRQEEGKYPRLFRE